VRTKIPLQMPDISIADIQILVPMRKIAAGTHAINNRLQAAFNPNSTDNSHRGLSRFLDGLKITFYEGDKVIHVENNYQLEVMNGEIGRVQSVRHDEKLRKDILEVLYDQGQSTERLIEYTSLEQLELAYATTIHKAQGNEYPVAIVLTLRSHHRMLTRNLLYTAITRGRRLVVLVHDPESLEMAFKTHDSRLDRHTRLMARIWREMDTT